MCESQGISIIQQHKRGIKAFIYICIEIVCKDKCACYLLSNVTSGIWTSGIPASPSTFVIYVCMYVEAYRMIDSDI